METKIELVYINNKDKEYLVIGDNIRNEVIKFDEYDEWNTVYDLNNEPIFDIQIWTDIDNGEPIYGIQYVDLIIDENGIISMGDNWMNPTGIIIVDKPLNEVIKIQNYIVYER